MKKILLSFLMFALVLGASKQSKAQCSGAVVLITNVSFNQSATHYIYSFNWTYIQGNASLQVRFSCGGNYIADGPCYPSLKDSAAGPHFVKDSFLISSVPCAAPAAKEIVIGIWTSSNCHGQYCPSNQNIPLPVQFSSFTAKRTNSSTVNLSWQTASELNNSGFEVQRNVNGNWETVIFIPSQASGGNSDQLLTYHFNDMNSVKGMSQYRIRQIDFDGKWDLSVVRAVRGDAVSVKTVIYPNPSLDGKVNVVFEDAAGIRDIVLTDLNGRVVRNWTGVSNNNLTIDNLNPGMYSLRITIRETGAQSVEKLVINKR